MKRLIEKGLMFGNLIEVSSPALVERYNRALKALTGKETALTDFHIDISGFSPEIGYELADEQYLNPDGCNRKFILMTTAQKTAPLLNVRFSTSRGILRQFITANEAQLFALTARDAVAGELLNTVFALHSASQLFDMRRVTIEADTIGGHVKDARKLAALIERFRAEEDGWRDDVLIAEMIGLARRTGDVTRETIDLPSMHFEQPNFWTSHFGGVYVFARAASPGVVSVGPARALGKLPVEHVLELDRRGVINIWLHRNGLVESIFEAKGVDGAALLRQKMDFVLVAEGERLGVSLDGASRADLRQVARQLGERAPLEFTGMAALLRWIETGGPKPDIRPDHPAWFYTLRARSGPDRDLVNMLLTELAPLDVRQLFICHKENFYKSYGTWSLAKRGWVADFLEREYKIDKAGARTALFGPEPGMSDDAPEAAAPAGRAPVAPIAAVGPWGAIGRSRKK